MQLFFLLKINCTKAFSHLIPCYFEILKAWQV